MCPALVFGGSKIYSYAPGPIILSDIFHILNPKSEHSKKKYLELSSTPLKSLTQSVKDDFLKCEFAAFDICEKLYGGCETNRFVTFLLLFLMNIAVF